MGKDIQLGLFSEAVRRSVASERVPKVWDVRVKDLESLSYSDLKKIFYGIHNLDVPNEILDLENPAEILAKYFAADHLKRDNYHRRLAIPAEFLGLIRYLNKSARGSFGVRGLMRDCKTRFDLVDSPEEERLYGLDEEIKRSFVESFFEDYRPSNGEEPDNPEAFYDPNIDVEDKRVYARRIYQFLKQKQREEKRH